MVDFTSALYLGLRHGSDRLRPWRHLTTGIPAALGSPPMAAGIASRLAELTGVEAATLSRTTLHAFLDVLALFGDSSSTIHLDAGSYPVARWAAERAGCRGARWMSYAHHDASMLHRQIRLEAFAGRRPVVVADGLCSGCGEPAPVREYLRAVREFGGKLVLDDTQALGVLGASPSAAFPCGYGGGGSLVWHAAGGAGVVLVSSLAKGFGAPLAMVGGAGDDVAVLERKGETRVHCSPPTFADLHAAENALEINSSYGDELRARLFARVKQLREGLAVCGIGTVGGPFPIQSLAPLPLGLDPRALQRRLCDLGIRTVLRLPACRKLPTVSLVLTARHTPQEIEAAVHAIGRVCCRRERLREPIASEAHEGRVAS